MKKAMVSRTSIWIINLFFIAMITGCAQSNRITSERPNNSPKIIHKELEFTQSDFDWNILIHGTGSVDAYANEVVVSLIDVELAANTLYEGTRVIPSLLVCLAMQKNKDIWDVKKCTRVKWEDLLLSPGVPYKFTVKDIKIKLNSINTLKDLWIAIAAENEKRETHWAHSQKGIFN